MADKIICNASYAKLDTLLGVLFPGVEFNRKDSGKEEGFTVSEKYLINIGSLNNRQKIDVFLEQINSELHTGDYFIGCADYQTSKVVKAPRRIFLAAERRLESIFTRIWYSLLKQHSNVRLSKMEILGRIYRYGFTIKDLQKKDNYIYFIAQKNVSL